MALGLRRISTVRQNAEAEYPNVIASDNIRIFPFLWVFVLCSIQPSKSVGIYCAVTQPTGGILNEPVSFEAPRFEA